MAAAAFSRVTMYADTLADNDRGYFPRIGVLDRLFNPRAGFHLVRYLHAALNTAAAELAPAATGTCAGGRFVSLNETAPVTLAIPDPGCAEMAVPYDADARVIDLAGGEVHGATANNGVVSVTLGRRGETIMPALIMPA